MRRIASLVVLGSALTTLLTVAPPASADDGSAAASNETGSALADTVYVGAGVGQTTFRGDCGLDFGCDDKDTAYKLYAGSRVHNIFGAEITGVYFGDVPRYGGHTEAQGADLSLVLNAPVTRFASVFGKVGGIYGWTRTSSDFPGVPTGNHSGFDLSFGGGVNLNLGGNWSLRGDWERYRLVFASGRHDLDLWTGGVSYRF